MSAAHYQAKNDTRVPWTGLPGGQPHRSEGPVRAWCHTDADWCHPEALCWCCDQEVLGR